MITTVVAGSMWGLAVGGDRHLAEFGPVVLRNGEVDDPWRLGEVRGQRLLRGLEVRGLHVRGPGVTIAERFDQHVLVRVVHASGPVEPQAARLIAARLGELPGDLGPGVGVLGQDPELGGDEDHGAPCPVTGHHRAAAHTRDTKAGGAVPLSQFELYGEFRRSGAGVAVSVRSMVVSLDSSIRSVTSRCRASGSASRACLSRRSMTIDAATR